jgi:hypothetical protein
MAVYSEHGRDDPDKKGSHNEFVRAAREQEGIRKDDRNDENNTQREIANRAIQEEQRRKAEERKKDKRAFVGKPLALRGPKEERKIVKVKNEVSAETQEFLNYFGEDLKSQLLEKALQNGNSDLKQKLDELAAEMV